MANFVHCIPLLGFIFLMILLNTPVHSTDTLSFHFDHFTEDEKDITLQGDAKIVYLDSLRLTHTMKTTVGRALYTSPVHLWEQETFRVSTFDTNFTFVLSAIPGYEKQPADGITFFIAPFETTIPTDSFGGLLGLFTPENALNASANQVVAVEFDTFINKWDPKDTHFAILENTISSETYEKFERKENEIVAARISYTRLRGQSGILTASYSYPPYTTTAATISKSINLDTVLPSWVSIGFSASTGDNTQTHILHTWSFSSKLTSINNAKEEVDMYNIVRDV